MQEETTTSKSASELTIAILVSTYHTAITSKLEEGARSAFINAGGIEHNCKTIAVVGAWELPIIAKTISLHEKYDAIVALGCIITGETTHDQVIGHAIAQGLMRTSLDWGHPVSMGVLTCQTIEQAEARAGGSSGNKGIEAMHAAIETEMTLREQHA
ncbi:MAG: 6,7-dimethyl-8-ribityllumazine synthase [Phycisphaerae bacterium]|nr:6,7-dimethyl-8-ribityllumazine synthase [Phycisphaerae bacterium]|tara:strand:- start:1839 stop:2309 length:471 start_codon:yes stop_codon:yes gene_type:complete